MSGCKAHYKEVTGEISQWSLTILMYYDNSVTHVQLIFLSSVISSLSANVLLSSAYVCAGSSLCD